MTTEISEERLDQLFLEAFDTNEAAMLDWATIKIELKALRKAYKDYNELIIDVFAKDRTPRYSYNGETKGKISEYLDQFGKAPKPGGRWLTPAERARDDWKRLGNKEQELFDVCKQSDNQPYTNKEVQNGNH